MKSLSLLFLVCAVAFGGGVCRTCNAQEDRQDVCEKFWHLWAARDIDAAVEVSSAPFIYCDGKSVIKLSDTETLVRQLKTIRNASQIGSRISVNIKRELLFKEIPIDSFRMKGFNRSKLTKFFNDDDQIFYVELKNVDDNQRDMFVLVVRRFDKKFKAIGILD